MEKRPTNPSEGQNKSTHEKHDAMIAEKYLKNLGITQADIVGKKTLDIGAGEGEFARWANTNGGDVTSIGFGLGPDQKRAHTHYAVADATALPFANDAFDLVVSHTAIPNVVSVRPNERVQSNLIFKKSHERRMDAVREAVRVLTPGGEIRFAPVVRNERNAPGPSRIESMETMLAELKSNPTLEVREELLEKDHRGFRDILSDTYRLVIRKKDADAKP